MNKHIVFSPLGARDRAGEGGGPSLWLSLFFFAYACMCAKNSETCVGGAVRPNTPYRGKKCWWCFQTAIMYTTLILMPPLSSYEFHYKENLGQLDPRETFQVTAHNIYWAKTCTQRLPVKSRMC